jgi:hypothetical protein
MNKNLDKLNYYLTNGWPEAFKKTKEIEKILLDLAGFGNRKEFLKAVSKETMVITFLAGFGTRWQDSFSKPQNHHLKEKCDPSKPRVLVKIANLIPKIMPGQEISAGIYNFLATKNLGRNLVIYRNSRKEIEEEILQPLKMTALFHQQTFPVEVGKPLGHGDALTQVRKEIKNFRFLITNFGSDANSRETIFLSLLCLYVLDKYKTDTWAILPSALMAKAKYPIYLDKKGMPTGIGQAKLKGGLADCSNCPSNVGIRVYLVKKLLPVIDYFEKYYQEKGSYEELNNGNNELALDNFDEYLIRQKKLQQFCLALPEEISHSAKKLEEIPNYLETLKIVLKKDRIID